MNDSNSFSEKLRDLDRLLQTVTKVIQVKLHEEQIRAALQPALDYATMIVRAIEQHRPELENLLATAQAQRNAIADRAIIRTFDQIRAVEEEQPLPVPIKEPIGFK